MGGSSSAPARGGKRFKIHFDVHKILDQQPQVFLALLLTKTLDSNCNFVCVCNILQRPYHGFSDEFSFCLSRYFASYLGFVILCQFLTLLGKFVYG
jgi:hypothetical protein